MAETKARGFNCIRADAGLNWCFDREGNPRGEMGTTGLKNVQFRSNATGNWKVALEEGSSYFDITAPAGLFAFKDNALTVDTALADLDYNIWVFNAKAGVKGLPKPLSAGLDWMHNARRYSPALYNRDQKDGFVASLLYGGLKAKGDWLAGYYFARIEKYAVVARFAQDDWLRWGGVTDTRSSNFAGHELRLAYALGPSFNVVSRLYVVEGLRSETAASVDKEDGRRLRVDLNVAF